MLCHDERDRVKLKSVYFISVQTFFWLKYYRLILTSLYEDEFLRS
jgi:hypothetical protein